MTCPYCKDGTREPPLNLERMKRMAVIHAYRLNGYNKSRTAKALGVARASLVSWVKMWNLDEVKK